MSTFFDVEPFSPSGRYLAVTKVPFIWRIPYPGDRATVCVIDLVAHTYREVYSTRGWGAQLGANVQWGTSDSTIFCNDLIDGKGTGVAIELDTLEHRVLDGPIYGLTPDRKYSFSGDLELMNAGIPGYGVPEGFLSKPHSHRDLAAEGVWRTELTSGYSELILSLETLIRALPEQEDFAGGSHYVFNVKVNRQGTRLLIVLFSRNVPGRSGWPTQLVTCDLVGGDIRLAMSNRLWRHGGHHPNWTPDGDHILMNLAAAGEPLRFVRFRFDGTGLETIAPGHRGSGHPSLNPAQTHLLTDAYLYDGFMNELREVPLRLVDLVTNEESVLAWVYTNRVNGPRRVDPHPVWSADGSRVCFNGVVDGRRQVMVADMTSLSLGKHK